MARRPKKAAKKTSQKRSIKRLAQSKTKKMESIVVRKEIPESLLRTLRAGKRMSKSELERILNPIAELTGSFCKIHDVQIRLFEILYAQFNQVLNTDRHRDYPAERASQISATMQSSYRAFKDAQGAMEACRQHLSDAGTDLTDFLQLGPDQPKEGK